MRTLRPLLAAAAATALVTAAGCAGQGTSSDDDDDASTLTFWNGFTGPDRAAVEALVEEYNESQDEVTIEMEIMPWDVFYDKLLPAFGSGSAPDIMAMDAKNLPQYADRDLLRDMSDYYEDPDTEAEVLVDPAVEAATFDDTSYGVPMNFTTMLMYWNKDMFAEAGLDPESPPADWDQMAEYAEQLTVDENGDGTPEQYALAIADNNTVPMWPILLWQGGGDVVSEDGTEATLGDPETIAAMEHWADLVIEDKIAPIGLNGADADALFQSEKAAMEIVGPWMTTGFAEAGIDFGLSMPPEGPGGSVTLGDSVSFAVNDAVGDAKAEAAKDFFGFWNSTDSQTYWSANTGFPPNRGDIPEQDLAENEYVSVFNEHVDQARVFLPNVQDVQQVNENLFEPAVQRVLNGDGTVEELFTEADGEIQAVLDQQRE